MKVAKNMKDKEKTEKEKFVEMSKISMALDNYDDLFSDFDPRPSSERAVSVDFLDEAKRAARDKEEGLELGLLMPKTLRDREEEVIIKKRLKEYFRKQYNRLKKEKMKVLKRGVYFVTAGIIFMFIATLILFKSSNKTFFMSFLIIFLDAPGWFFFWVGLDLIFLEHKKMDPELEFYKKMSKADIHFNSY